MSFGPFVLDRSAQVLLSGGKPVALGQRGFALLEALASDRVATILDGLKLAGLPE